MNRKMPGAALWNGLHDHELSPGNADVVVIGLPYDGAVSLRRGAAEAPDRIRSVSGHLAPTTEDGRSLQHLSLVDIGNLEPGGQSQEEYFSRVEEKAAELFATSFPTFIGGDHSVTIPLVSAAAARWGADLGVVHLDAHLDLCMELDGNTLSHGCTHRRALENNSLKPHQFCFVGIRSYELQELDYLEGSRATVIKASEIYRQGIDRAVEQVLKSLAGIKAVYITIDIDFLDPAFAPGTGTPKPGGFSTRELFALLRGLSVLPLVGMDLVEVSPPLDHGDITSFAAQRIITETWGLFLPG